MNKGAILLILAVLSACSADETTRLDDRGYFPLKVNNRWTYSVSETTYSEFDDPVTANFEIQWIVADSFANQVGGYTYIINRSKRGNALQEWEPLDSWSVRITNTELVIQEGNQSYVKLVFPVTEGGSWDVNIYNTSDSDEVLIKSVGVGYTTELDELFQSCIIVNQNDEVNAVYEDVRDEIFAYGVGLVEKHSKIIEYCTSFPCQQAIIAGSETLMTLKDYEL